MEEPDVDVDCTAVRRAQRRAVDAEHPVSEPSGFLKARPHRTWITRLSTRLPLPQHDHHQAALHVARPMHPRHAVPLRTGPAYARCGGRVQRAWLTCGCVVCSWRRGPLAWLVDVGLVYVKDAGSDGQAPRLSAQPALYYSYRSVPIRLAHSYSRRLPSCFSSRGDAPLRGDFESDDVSGTRS